MTEKICPIMSNPSAQMENGRIEDYTNFIECQKSRCMAWREEVRIDLTTVMPDKDGRDMILSLLSSLTPLGIGTDAAGMVIMAHCALLEGKK